MPKWWATSWMTVTVISSSSSSRLERWCTSREELEEEITVTVIHEVAHHFGIPDERLHELGWE